MAMILHGCVVLLIWFGLRAVHSDKGWGDCGFLMSPQWLDSVKVVVNLTKNGFHRELLYTVQFGVSFPEELQTLLVQSVSSDLYMDFYQLQTLREEAGLHVLLDTEVDLEAPAYKSPAFIALVYPHPDPTLPGHVTGPVPVHGRYHRPSDTNTREKVEIKYPKLLLKLDTCEHGELPLSNLSHKIVYVPCSVKNISICSWIEITKLQVSQSLTLELPVGDKSLVFLVCGGTLFITVLCNFILTAAIWKHALSDFY